MSFGALLNQIVSALPAPAAMTDAEARARRRAGQRRVRIALMRVPRASRLGTCCNEPSPERLKLCAGNVCALGLSSARVKSRSNIWLFQLRPPAQLPPRRRGLQLARPCHVAHNSRVRRGWQHVHVAAACAKRGKMDVPCQRVEAAAHDEVLLLKRLEDFRPADAAHGRQRGALQRPMWRCGKRRQHSTVLRGRCGSGRPSAGLQPRMHSFGSRFAQRITRCDVHQAWAYRRRALQPKHPHTQGCKENK